MKKVLSPAFFDRPTLTVAKDLLGKYLVRRVQGRTVGLMIVETEGYDGFKDLASHARRGQTPRNTPMFGEPGLIYVYFTYGMHWMLNVVCGKKKYPAAVLIRGLAPSITTNQHTGVCKYVVLDGPAKLTKFLKIDKNLNHKPLGKKSGLWVEDRGVVVLPRHIVRTPRIGVDYAGEYTKKHWRFVLKSK